MCSFFSRRFCHCSAVDFNLWHPPRVRQPNHSILWRPTPNVIAWHFTWRVLPSCFLVSFVDGLSLRGLYFVGGRRSTVCGRIFMQSPYKTMRRSAIAPGDFAAHRDYSGYLPAQTPMQGDNLSKRRRRSAFYKQKTTGQICGLRQQTCPFHRLRS